MRLDKFLKVTKLIKRRTQAQVACKNNRVYLNNHIAKSSSIVRVGDEIKIVSSIMLLRVKVLQIPLNNQFSDDLFVVIEQTKLTEE
ncbi:MAG: RNA-binding S4 domain-containing protein [Candidatus Atribacteria bacterium]|nr:RNA-binding S4 domain-containing protein [Candidatus Atribacteria bacterium]